MRTKSTYTAEDAMDHLMSGRTTEAHDLDEGDSRKADALTNGYVLHGMLSRLQSYDHPELVRLGKLTHQVLNSRRIAPGLGPAISCLTLQVSPPGSDYLGLLLIPWNWADLVEHSSVVQMWSLVGICSKILDLYYGVFELAYSRLRAEMWQAELALYLELPAFTMRAEEKDALSKFPQGLKSAAARDLVYTFPDVLLA